MRWQSLSHIPLPSFILANARSLCNKTEELQAFVCHQHEYREACILAVTETWLGESDSDSNVATDCYIKITSKSCGGGVCLYIDEHWGKNQIKSNQILFIWHFSYIKLQHKVLYINKTKQKPTPPHTHKHTHTHTVSGNNYQYIDMAGH